MKNKNDKWPEILGFDLQTLKVQVMPGLKKTGSGEAPTGETFSVYSGPINHWCFEKITLTAWDHAGGYPNHILLQSENGENMGDAGLHLSEVLGEPEEIDQENYCWRNNQLYLQLTMEDDFELEIYLRRQVELESKEFRQLFYTPTIPQSERV